MKKSQSALLLLVLLVLAGAGFWLLSGDGTVHQASLSATIEEPSKAPADPADLTGTGDSSTLVAGDSKSTRGDATQEVIEYETAPVRVQVLTPLGSPPDDTLAVVAVPRSELGGEEIGDWLAGRESGFSRVLVDGTGKAQVEVPVGVESVLVIDGKYLFLEDPVLVTSSSDSVQLKPTLGAYVTGAFNAPDNRTPEGEVSMLGMNFGRRGGMGRRAVALDSSNFAFRGVDTELTWTLVPELESSFADMQMGLELNAGEETVVDLELMNGVRMTGRVVDEDGNPLEDVRVEVARAQQWMPQPDNQETRTDADGNFALAGLPPGKITLEARQEGRLRQKTDPMEVADGDSMDEITITMSLGASLSGTVRFPDGTPAAGASVQAEVIQRSEWGGWGGSRRRTMGRAETDANGAFRITGLKEGKFTLRASHEPSASEDEQVATWRVVEEKVEADGPEVALVLEGPATFAGRVIDDRGEPVLNFSISARSAEDGGPRERTEYKTEDGRFTFAMVGPGDWKIRASADKHSLAEPVELKLPTEQEELVIQLQRTASVAGRVFDNVGSPLAGATVRASDGSGAGNPWSGPGGETVETDEEGNFRFDELAPGSIEMTASAEGWADGEAVLVDLPPGSEIEDQSLAVRIGGTILGTVLTPEGDPLAGRRVTWGRNSMGFGSRSETTSGSDGTFRFEHVTPGEWVVTASPSMAEMGERMRSGDGESAWVEVMGQLISESITIADGETLEVYMGGEPRIPVRIFGVVTQAGEAVENAQVFAVSEGSAVFQGMKTVRTEPDGSYSLEVDQPGAYVVSTRVGRAGVEVLTDIPRADEARVDLSIPVGKIEGYVEKPDGKSAKGIRFQIQREDGLGRMRWDGTQATSNEEGYYSFEALEPGRYTVRANIASWNGRADERYGTSVASNIEVEKDSVASRIDFKLLEAGSVEGLVESEAGSPISGASIFFRDSSGRMVTTISGTTTDAAGRFKRSGLAPGDYTLSVRAAEAASSDQATVRVSSSQAAEARLVVETGSRMMIKLEDEGGEARRARVEVFDENDREVGGLMTQQDMRKMFNEGSSSLERTVGPLPPGRYTVRATTPDGRISEKKVRLSSRRAEKTVRLKLES